MTALAIRSAGLLLLALNLVACGGATEASSAPSAPSVTASRAESPDASTASPQSSTAPSQGEPSEGSAPSACLDADILAALETYKDVEVPADPTFDEVADALEGLELEGNAAEFRDGVVEVLRDDTYTVDEDRLHDMMFSLIPLQSEIDLAEC